jgi:hypothetical protein
MKTSTFPSNFWMNLLALRPAFLLIAFAVACFTLTPQARAVCQKGCDAVDGNTLLGDDALISNTSGTANTGIGASALSNNTSGFNNTATGGSALRNNTTGSDNTAHGIGALLSSTTGSDNTANGAFALEFNTSGFNDTASGARALLSNTIGNNNTASGTDALLNNITGSGNIALGYQAGRNVTGGNNIDIGNAGASNESGKIRIGTNRTHTNTFIAGISGVTVPDGVGVIIDGRGHMGTIVSSERFKDGIKPMEKTSEAIFSLNPVTFRYKHDLDPNGVPQFGLVAEQVEKINPDLVARDEQGKPYSVRYEAVNAMLLNEFLKAHRKIEEQDATIAHQQKQINALTAGLQKVSADLEADKSVPKRLAGTQ